MRMNLASQMKLALVIVGTRHSIFSKKSVRSNFKIVNVTKELAKMSDC